LNIGFDSDGNLDTYSLSAFVGSVDGFVTTWYDQSGNVKNATQTTAANQPYIIVGGALQTNSGKPSLYFDGASRYLDCGYLNNGTKASNFSTFISANFTAVNQTRVIFSSMDAGGNGKDTYNTFGIHSGTSYQMYGGAGGGIYYKYWRTSNVPTQSLPYLFEQHYKSNISPFIGTFYWNNTLQSVTDWFGGTSQQSTGTEFKTSIGRPGEYNGGYHQGYVQEIATYFSDQMSNRSGIVSNINTYYSVYPNPTSVWNLLTAAYSADTKSLPSLKTSLYAAYNGESNTNDSFGTNNGTAQGGLTYGTGKIGNAFQFNGTNAYVSLPNNSLNFTGDFSYSLWVNLTNLTGVLPLINNHNEVGPDYRGNLVFLVGNVLYFRINYSNSTPVDLTYTYPGTNQWVHVVFTRKSSTRSRMYINGTLVISNTSTINPTYYPTMPYNVIGAYYDSNGWRYLKNGDKVDAVTAWNKELTQSEITELYNSGNGAQYIGDNFYKPTTNDALGINNGTAQGGLTWGLGKLGTAFVGNGTNAYVRLPDNSLNLTSPFSYSFWIKSSDTAGYTVIVGNIQSTRATYGFAHGYQFWLQYNKISIGFRDGMDSTNYGLDSVANVATGSWNHVVITYKYTINNTNGIKIYINGSLDSSRNAPNSTNFYSLPMKPAIMARNTSGSYEYPLSSGSMLDALNIWQKELSAAEVTELYNSGNGKQYPN
jgi:hypothetical protein